jgi:UDP-N-acetylmuramate dehydrogenase
MKMQTSALSPADIERLQSVFGDRLKLDENLSRYTSARVGGPADGVVVAGSAAELAQAVRTLWDTRIPFFVLGGGSNILVSDAGVRGVVILNQARQVRFLDSPDKEMPHVWAESGANFGSISRQAAVRGLSGLEWAAGIPGTVGGAVVGNAGAHGADMAGNLVLAEILHLGNKDEIEEWKVEKFEYVYRSSVIKSQFLRQQDQPGAVVLEVIMKLQRSQKELVQERVNELVEYRRRTQPPGASMGSMFKNPPGDYAGRLIEAAGMKGISLGQVEVSSLHGNFFINRGGAVAADIHKLIRLVQDKVQNQFGILLELEIELVGEWG